MRYIGFSEWPIDKIEAALSMPGVERFVSDFSLRGTLSCTGLRKRSCCLSAHDPGSLRSSGSLLAQGILTGKYQPREAVLRRSRAPPTGAAGSFIDRAWLEPRTLEAVAGLAPIAAEAGLTTAQFALAWVLRQSNVSAAIVGASRPEQVAENAAAVRVPLLRRSCSRAPMKHPLASVSKTG